MRSETPLAPGYARFISFLFLTGVDKSSHPYLLHGHRIVTNAREIRVGDGVVYLQLVSQQR